jgi:hypothetical protein
MAADPTVLDLANRAAHAVRDLNHRTRHADAFTGPAQLYRLVGDLGLLVGGLPQLLGQLEGWLHAEHDAGRVRSDNHADPGPTVSDAADDLAEAGDAARDVASLFNGAHQHLAHLGSLAPPDHPSNIGGHRSNDLAMLTDGPEPGWRDEKGRPAPWPDDFADPDSDWTTAGSATADAPPVTHAGEPLL